MNEDMEALLTGVLTGLLMQSHVHDLIKPFTLMPTEDRRTLVLRFNESTATYRIDVRFVANFANWPGALQSVEKGAGRD